MFPCCFILAKNKDYNIYKIIIERLKENSGSFQLNPKRLTCDFELALIKSLKLHFPTAAVKGCLFHYGQCIWKNINLNGFKTKYSQDEVFKLYVKKLISLAIVPVSDVPEAFELINTTNIIGYFNRTWMCNENFLLQLWNHCQTVGPKTNNHVEGFHSKFNKYLQSKHPNQGWFINCIN